MPNGSTQFVGVASSGVLEYNIRFANGSWRGWDAVSQPGVTETDADIAGMPDGSSQMVAFSAGRTVSTYHAIRYANGSWQREGWVELPNPDTEFINPGSGGSTPGLVADIASMPNGSAQLIFRMVN